MNRFFDLKTYTPCMLMVPFVGIPVIFITRAIFYFTQYGEYERSFPTISKTSAFDPASFVFAPGFVFVSFCIVMCWIIVYRLNTHRLNTLGEAHPEYERIWRLNRIACSLGIAAGIFLGLMAVITLNVHDGIHMALAYAFFPSQIFAFVFDTVASRRLTRALGEADGRDKAYSLNFKPFVAALTFILGWTFLFHFLMKNTDLYGDPATSRVVYVIIEYTLASFLLSYAALYYPEAKRYFERDGERATARANATT